MEDQTKKQTAMQSTYDQIKEMILNNQLPIEQPIPQNKLMETYGFSRTPLRDALTKLSQEGLVNWEQNKRITIKHLTEIDIDQLCAMRIMLEGFAAFVTIPLLTDSDIEEAENCMKSIRELHEGQVREYETLHRRFHRIFTGKVGPWITEDIEHLNDQAARYRSEFRNISYRFNATDHEALIELAKKRDAESFVMELANHYARTTLRVISDRSPIYEPIYTRNALRLLAKKISSH